MRATDLVFASLESEVANRTDGRVVQEFRYFRGPGDLWSKCDFIDGLLLMSECGMTSDSPFFARVRDAICEEDCLPPTLVYDLCKRAFASDNPRAMDERVVRFVAEFAVRAARGAWNATAGQLYTKPFRMPPSCRLDAWRGFLVQLGMHHRPTDPPLSRYLDMRVESVDIARTCWPNVRFPLDPTSLARFTHWATEETVRGGRPIDDDFVEDLRTLLARQESSEAFLMVMNYVQHGAHYDSDNRLLYEAVETLTNRAKYVRSSVAAEMQRPPKERSVLNALARMVELHAERIWRKKQPAEAQEQRFRPVVLGALGVDDVRRRECAPALEALGSLLMSTEAIEWFGAVLRT